MSPHKNSQNSANIARLLTHCQIIPEDIDWANDLPAGRALLDWISSQVAADDDEDDDSMLAALSSIALDHDELLLAGDDGTGADESHNNEVLARYLSPARMVAQIEYKTREAELLEVEAELTKSRIKQTKITNKECFSSIARQKEYIASTEKSFRATHERLADLAAQSDNDLVHARDSATALIEILAESCRTNYSADLAKITRRRGAIIERFQHALTSERKSSTWTPEELQVEASRLQEGLKSLARTHNTTFDSVDVRSELSRAWNLDQHEALQARNAALFEAIEAFETEVVSPLAQIQDDLFAKNELVAEAEAVLGALAEELEDAVEDAEDARQIVLPGHATNAHMHADLEAQLKAMLKSTEGVRPPDAAPLILLDQNDIFEELRLRLRITAQSVRSEQTQTASLAADLQKLRSSHNALLDVVYANAPVNTSPPFGSSPATATIERDAREKKDHLAEGAKLLSADVATMESQKSQRRLDAYLKKVQSRVK